MRNRTRIWLTARLGYVLAAGLCLGSAPSLLLAEEPPLASGMVGPPLYPLTAAELARVVETMTTELQATDPPDAEDSLLPGDWSLHWSAPAAEEERIPGEPMPWKPDTGLSLDFDADDEEVMLEWRVGF